MRLPPSPEPSPPTFSAWLENHDAVCAATRKSLRAPTTAMLKFAANVDHLGCGTAFRAAPPFAVTVWNTSWRSHESKLSSSISGTSSSSKPMG